MSDFIVGAFVGGGVALLCCGVAYVFYLMDKNRKHE